jgi:hypothetical protein
MVNYPTNQILINDQELTNYKMLLYGTTNLNYIDGNEFNLSIDNIILQA